MRPGYLLIVALLALLAGCAGQKPQEALRGQGDPAQWQAHKSQIAQLDGWQISGKVGIRAPGDSGSATLFWLQRQAYYDIRLSGPLGQGASRLTGRPGAIVLDIANQGRYEAASPEALLQERLGWRLPVSNRLARLQQDGWQVDYLSYSEHDGYALPARLKLHGHDLDITLVIKDWQPRLLGR